jgi:hypothetical protein
MTASFMQCLHENEQLPLTHATNACTMDAMTAWA